LVTAWVARSTKALLLGRFGVVILSPDFFSKRWPKTELAGLRALEENGKKVILPVWHGIDKTTVAKNSPVLAYLAIGMPGSMETIRQRRRRAALC
jgi:hypothetical protein